MHVGLCVVGCVSACMCVRECAGACTCIRRFICMPTYKLASLHHTTKHTTWAKHILVGGCVDLMGNVEATIILPLLRTDKPSVTISPLNDTYVVGDRITMEVDARPMPGTYEWVGLSLNMVFKSRRLTITRHMVGNQTFVATATNNLLGKNLKGEYQFSFFVPTRESMLQWLEAERLFINVDALYLYYFTYTII